MLVARAFRAASAVVVMGLVFAGCAAGPPAGQPDPLISCSTVGGSISYTPPATNSGVDVTIDALGGTGFTGCTDHTGAGITGASLAASLVFPAFKCGLSSVGALVGSGTGRLSWSDGSTSDVTASALERNVGAGFVVEFTVTVGRWSGARASFSIAVTAVQGGCTPGSPLTGATVAGFGPFEMHGAITPLRPPLTGAVQVSSGSSHTCAVVADGTVNCWGSNSDDQLGNILLGPGASATVPVHVVGLSTAARRSARGAATPAPCSKGGP